MLNQLMAQLGSCGSLTAEQVRLAVAELVDEGVPAPLKADFLGRLAQKGETVDEIAAFVRELRAHMVKPDIDEELRRGELLDVVGTGGDRLSTFNISTTVALVAAAGGVRVAKHGNRASTSSVGSADVMEALGIPFNHGPVETVRMLRSHGFAFFFAPNYHPAFKHIIPARKLCAERGQATIFNFLGPLLNPGFPSAMLVGVARPGLCQPLARVLQSLGVRRAMVVCGTVPQSAGGVRHLDEFSTLGPTHVAEFYQQSAMSWSDFVPEAFPLQPATLADLRGGDKTVNAEIIRRVLRGEERGPKRDAVLLNGSAALFIGGAVRSMAEAWDTAAEIIDSGRAWKKFEELRGFNAGA